MGEQTFEPNDVLPGRLVAAAAAAAVAEIELPRHIARTVV